MDEYQQLLKKIYSLQQSKSKRADLARIKRLDSALGNPSKAFASIHIAGTNGKGSVAVKIARGLELEGKRVGLYTSPHVTSFCERIVVNGVMIEKAEVVEQIKRILALDPETTFFEVATLMAFAHFSRQEVDFAVVETGLGGRLDATNIISPQLSVITSISLDHCDVLGSTIEQIALEKAGIIKSETPVIIGPCVPAPLIMEDAAAKNAPCFQVEGEFLLAEDENRAIASAALSHLGVLKCYAEEGIKAKLPCRQEAIASHPIPIIFDACHNPSGVEALFRAVKAQWISQRCEVVCGFSKDKDAAACLEVIQRYASGVHLVQPSPVGKFIETDALAKMCYELGVVRPFQHQEIELAIKAAKKRAMAKKEPLIVCGSFYLMDEARRAL